MCGRYTAAKDFGEPIKLMGIVMARVPFFAPRYNIAPTQLAPVIYHDRHQPAVKLMRWGLIPSWAKDESVGNALVKWGGVAALKDAAARDEVRKKTLQLCKKTAAELESYGYNVIPSESNFFMVHLRREVWPIIQEFSQRGILVGRPFPPMLEYLWVSVGDAGEMDRFLVAFKEILPAGKPGAALS